jgi:hypothetical protein
MFPRKDLYICYLCRQGSLNIHCFERIQVYIQYKDFHDILVYIHKQLDLQTLDSLYLDHMVKVDKDSLEQLVL